MVAVLNVRGIARAQSALRARTYRYRHDSSRMEWTLPAVAFPLMFDCANTPPQRQKPLPLHCRHRADSSTSVTSSDDSQPGKARHLAQRPPSA